MRRWMWGCRKEKNNIFSCGKTRNTTNDNYKLWAHACKIKNREVICAV
jgi:hypothetical protein